VIGFKVIEWSIEPDIELREMIFIRVDCRTPALLLVIAIVIVEIFVGAARIYSRRMERLK
jgi:hypothetical protein